MSVAPEPYQVTDLWNEDGTRVWIRHDLCATASKARYKAWAGKGLPMPLSETGVHLTDLYVHVIYASDHDSDAFDEWPWKRCLDFTPGAVKFWEVGFE